MIAAANAGARARLSAELGGPLLLADWERALFLHFEVPRGQLQPQVPYELDLLEGHAYVSLVFFTMRRMRLAHGGRLAEWLCGPLQEQRFLNLRTYVRHGEETGIHFLAEWVSHWLCVQFGPLLYGLPYHWGRHDFQHDHERRRLRGHVETRDADGFVEYESAPEGARFETAEAGTLDAFLLERYMAFTGNRERRMCFRIWHEPWQQVGVRLERFEQTLLSAFAPWWKAAGFVSANYSLGVRDVWMGRPRRIR
ncbi:MAG: DUF2071 domain-containing protein [Verrucomicrobiota bacterium]